MNPLPLSQSRIATVVAFALVALPSIIRAQLFTDLRSTQFSEIAGVVSTSHGPEVIGAGGNDEFVTSRWTAATGRVDIAGLHTEPYPFIPEHVSSSGKVIVGRGAGTDDIFRPSAYRWTQQTGLQELAPNIRDAVFSERTRVSADGTAVSGFDAVAGFRWTQATGRVQIGAKLNDVDVISHDNPLFFPKALSRDGSILVGMNTVSPFERGEASRWTESTGLVGLGFLFNNGAHETSLASGITGNGSVIVGTGYFDDFSEAYRWTADGGMKSLGVLAGGNSSFAVGISSDGGRIFGGTNLISNPFVSEPFVWTAAGGMRSLVDELSSRGAGGELAGWQLREIAAFSTDGRYVVGRGIGPDGRQGFWLADLGMSPVPEPATIGLAAATGLLTVAALRRRYVRAAT